MNALIEIHRTLQSHTLTNEARKRVRRERMAHRRADPSVSQCMRAWHACMRAFRRLVLPSPRSGKYRNSVRQIERYSSHRAHTEVTVSARPYTRSGARRSVRDLFERRRASRRRGFSGGEQAAACGPFFDGPPK